MNTIALTPLLFELYRVLDLNPEITITWIVKRIRGSDWENCSQRNIDLVRANVDEETEMFVCRLSQPYGIFYEKN